MGTFGVDISNWQGLEVDMMNLRKRNYRFVLMLTSHALHTRNTYFQLQKRQAQDVSISVLGAYHFLDGSASGEAQADRFVDILGADAENMLTVVDFEDYPQGQPPNNDRLMRFSNRFKERLPGKQLGVYTGKSWWESPPASGRIEQYGLDWVWEAWYLDMEDHYTPQRYYWDVAQDYGFTRKIGGKTPKMWQFTSTGIIDDEQLDINYSPLTVQELKALI